MRMEEEDLDRILSSDRIDPGIKLAALEHHAEEGLRRETGSLAAIITLVILGAAVAFFVYYSNHTPTQEPVRPVIEQHASGYSTPNLEYK